MFPAHLVVIESFCDTCLIKVLCRKKHDHISTSPKTDIFLLTLLFLPFPLMNIAHNNVSFRKKLAAVDLTATKSIERTDKNLLTPPTSDTGDDLKHAIVDRILFITILETIHQMSNIPSSEYFKIFPIIEYPLLK